MIVTEDNIVIPSIGVAHKELELTSYLDGDVLVETKHNAMYFDRDSAYALWLWLGEHLKRTANDSTP